MMIIKVLIIACVLMGSHVAFADRVQAAIDLALEGLVVKVSDDPYSRAIERMYIGYNAMGEPEVGIAYREIESFKPITGIVIVHMMPDGFILHEALFPDIGKIKNAKDRQQVLTVLKQFRDVPFDPLAEKSAVDGLSGATRYGSKAAGYLNYMARRIALDMNNPPQWAGLKKE